MDSITQKLTQDHKEIIEMLNVIIAMANDQEDFIKHIQKIRWRLNKHMYLEEKAVFSYCQIMIQFNKSHIQILLSEHDQLLSQIAAIEKLTNEQQIKDKITIFLQKIKEHVDFEITNFYYLIDKNLITEDKQKMLHMIAKDFNLGFYPIQKIREYGIEVMKSCVDPNQK
jgi:hemerythrin-like domain-containing protein